jgi:hypothetical protein
MDLAAWRRVSGFHLWASVAKTLLDSGAKII